MLPLYFDGANIKGNTFNAHIHNVRRVLTHIPENGFILKIRFYQTQLKYLQHIVETGVVSLDP